MTAGSWDGLFTASPAAALGRTALYANKLFSAWVGQRSFRWFATLRGTNPEYFKWCGQAKGREPTALLEGRPAGTGVGASYQLAENKVAWATNRHKEVFQFSKILGQVKLILVM